VCPGLGIGLKFILNSPAKVVSNCVQIKTTEGLGSQKTPGINNKVTKALTQLRLKPNQSTTGSKIENKFPIYFK